MDDAPLDTVPRWVRLAMVALAVPNLVAGLWAVVAPQSWYDRFPGFMPYLVAAEPPYNAHLATDAGAGLLASGVVILLAAWFADVRTSTLGLLAYLAFAVPHAAYHWLNESPGLTAAEDVTNVVTLVIAAVVPVALLVVVRRSGHTTPSP